MQMTFLEIFSLSILINAIQQMTIFYTAVGIYLKLNLHTSNHYLTSLDYWLNLHVRLLQFLNSRKTIA